MIDVEALTYLLGHDLFTVKHDVVNDVWSIRMDDEEATPPTLSEIADARAEMDALPANLRSYVAEVRWTKEIAGVPATVNGDAVVVSTARGNDRTMLHVTYSSINNSLRTDGATFNFSDGVPRSVTNAEMTVAILTALSYVQACFDRGAEVMAAIEAETVTSRAQVDAAFVDVTSPWTP